MIAITTVVSRGNDDSTGTTVGLPNTSDYHSLLVDPADQQRLTLGTHNGLYVSDDGGRRWRHDALSGDDAMNLARPGASTIWLAGHNVFKKSSDGGVTWTDVGPSGLPGLDIHGFTVTPGTNAFSMRQRRETASTARGMEASRLHWPPTRLAARSWVSSCSRTGASSPVTCSKACS